MALPSAVVEEGVSKVFSYISGKVQDRASIADTIARLEIALSRLDFVLEKTGKIAITYISLLRSRKVLKLKYMEGIQLLNKHKPQEEKDDGHEKMGQVEVRSSSYLQWIAGDRAANFSISSLFGMGKEKKLLSSSIALTFERYADWAEKFVAEAESSCPLRNNNTFRYPFLRHLFQGKTLWYKMVKNPSQSLSFCLHPVILEGRGVEVTLVYLYEDRRMPEKCFRLFIWLRISEDTDIIGIAIKCIQWFTSQFKLVAESAIGELALLPNVQDISLGYGPPLSYFVKDVHVSLTERWRPDPICCNGNSNGTLANKSSIEIPEPVIYIIFCSNISAPKNSLRNAPVCLTAFFVPHYHLCYCSNKEISIRYGGKYENRNGTVQQLEEIARAEALDYLVHEQEPTDYALLWLSTHGIAHVTLRQSISAIPRPSRRVSKRKR